MVGYMGDIQNNGTSTGNDDAMDNGGYREMIVNCAYWYSLTVTVGLSNGASRYQMASFGNLLE